MVALACIELQSFDYNEYVKACRACSVFWRIWKPSPDNDTLRYDRYVIGSQSKQDCNALMALYAWANRTDPGNRLRYAGMRAEWLALQPKHCETKVMRTHCKV